MSGDLDLEQRYRRVLRLLPGYHRANWVQDMVAALLESSPTDDPEEDEYIIEFGKPRWPEVTGVAGLAAPGRCGRYFAPAAASYDAPGTPEPEGRRAPVSRHAREGVGAVWAAPVFG